MKKKEFLKRMERWYAAGSYAKRQVDQGNIDKAVGVMRDVVMPLTRNIWDFGVYPLAVSRGWIEEGQ